MNSPDLQPKGDVQISTSICSVQEGIDSLELACGNKFPNCQLQLNDLKNVTDRLLSLVNSLHIEKVDDISNKNVHLSNHTNPKNQNKASRDQILIYVNRHRYRPHVYTRLR